MKLLFTLFTLMILPLSVNAEEVMSKQVGVGDKIPTQLKLPNAKGEVQSFEALKGKKGLVLFFIRSADWCPYCQVQLLDLRKGEADPILEAGYNVAILSYDTPEKLNKFATRYKFDLPMLSDEGSETIKAFGILNEDKKPDEFGYGIPHPHIYVIGTDGTILADLSKESYTRRPEISDITDEIQKIK